ncbi:MAG TPA: cytochrome c biogenesis protein DipZ [Steroidobacteraceae bacterium]|nr:cytochrome c biogenesis protein DipZ [Steroidobacteraceae bacterium]
MVLIILAYLGGALTILSPCILPVLPFVFARAGQPFVRSVLPLLLGMVITFAAVATLAAVGGGWAVRANNYGRVAAMVLLAVFGVMLLWPALSDHLTRPFVRLGNRLTENAPAGQAGSPASSFLLGIATGFLWAPCAGPILGLLLTGAALQGANATTSLLLLTYAAGAATSLALALLVGGKVFTALKRSLGASEWVRRGLGVAVLLAVAVIALGMDTGLLTRLSIARTSSIEQSLLDRLRPNAAKQGSAAAATADGALPDEGMAPALDGAVTWLNSPPLTLASLHGKVVLVDFWTYSCINCLRSLPYVRGWAAKYRDHGLVVIGVHAPEFAFEKNLDNVSKAVKDLGITYPIAVDNNYAIWQAFNNEYWPAHYFIDANGHLRGHHFGEGDYAESERVIQRLLAEAGNQDVPGGMLTPSGSGAEAAADNSAMQSPETYVGYGRASNFENTGPQVFDKPNTFTTPATLALNHWGLGGLWNVQSEQAVLVKAPGTVSFRFHARDLHFVLGPAADGKPVRFRVLLDGKPPGEDHGADVDAAGNGVVRDQRLYQLIRQTHAVQDRTFTIEFLDPGVQASSFTFG